MTAQDEAPTVACRVRRFRADAFTCPRFPTAPKELMGEPRRIGPRRPGHTRADSVCRQTASTSSRLTAPPSPTASSPALASSRSDDRRTTREASRTVSRFPAAAIVCPLDSPQGVAEGDGPTEAAALQRSSAPITPTTGDRSTDHRDATAVDTARQPIAIPLTPPRLGHPFPASAACTFNQTAHPHQPDRHPPSTTPPTLTNNPTATHLQPHHGRQPPTSTSRGHQPPTAFRSTAPHLHHSRTDPAVSTPRAPHAATRAARQPLTSTPGVDPAAAHRHLPASLRRLVASEV
jgi:hypothetical protein